MSRTVDAIDGLGLFGPARVGPVALESPAVLWSRWADGPEPPGPLRLSRDGAEERPGHRRLLVQGPDGAIACTIPILAPEISAQGARSESVADGVLYVHWPAAEEDRTGSPVPELLVLGNARALFAAGEPFVTAIRGIRERFGAGPLLWAPRVALPHRLALLAYLGVDLTDSTEALWQVARGRWLDGELGVLAGEPPGSPCDCEGCRTGGAARSQVHALLELDRARRAAASAARRGKLRELVEAHVGAEPALAEMLRYADRELADRLATAAPVVGGMVRPYVYREALRRPEVRRFRSRFLERYRPPGSKEVLLLVPCSRTKPYRVSPSHRRFGRALYGLARAERVHVVSVTSPLGLVPRELEDVYPARQYDIPVTGEWDELERAAVLEALEHLVRHGRYRAAIAHLDPDEYAFLRSAWPPGLPVRWTVADDRTGTPEAIRALHEALGAETDDLPPIPGGPLTAVREGLREVAAMQFGRPAAERLFQAPVRLMGRPWFQRLVDGQGTDLATWREERGLFQLTVAGGHRMLPAHALEVQVHADVRLTGDLFVPGVARADRTICPGDAVLVVREGTLLAVGEAVLPGALMTELFRGLAVRVRHRAHGEAGAPTAP